MQVATTGAVTSEETSITDDVRPESFPAPSEDVEMSNIDDVIPDTLPDYPAPTEEDQTAAAAPASGDDNQSHNQTQYYPDSAGYDASQQYDADPNSYDQSQYDQSQYDQSQYDQSQYDQSQYDQSQYDQSQYNQSQYDQSQYNAQQDDAYHEQAQQQEAAAGCDQPHAARHAEYNESAASTVHLSQSQHAPAAEGETESESVLQQAQYTDQPLATSLSRTLEEDCPCPESDNTGSEECSREILGNCATQYLVGSSANENTGEPDQATMDNNVLEDRSDTSTSCMGLGSVPDKTAVISLWGSPSMVELLSG